MSGKDEAALRTEVVRAARLMYRAGLIAGLDGNVSARLGERELLITPSGKAKGFIAPEDLLVVDMAGRVLEGEGRPTSEIRMHLAVYEMRPDAGAVVHGHPAFCVAASLAGLDLMAPYLPEVHLMMRGIPTAAYATPGTREVPDSIRKLLRSHDTVILARHGALSLGRDPLDAFLKLEKAEHAAKTIFFASLTKNLEPLSEEELRKLKNRKSRV